MRLPGSAPQSSRPGTVGDCDLQSPGSSALFPNFSNLFTEGSKWSEGPPGGREPFHVSELVCKLWSFERFALIISDIQDSWWMRGLSVFHARCLKFLRSRSLRTQGFSRYGDQGPQFLAHFRAEGCFCVYPGSGRCCLKSPPSSTAIVALGP